MMVLGLTLVFECMILSMPVWAYTGLTKAAMFISCVTADVSQLQLCAEMDLLQTEKVDSFWQG